ncbi:MAG: polyprenyl synthetase family protein [Oscillospiraceae bacterium]|nr:polyprenyl synthetase family protein [Oscillospiraceae bacterium]
MTRTLNQQMKSYRELIERELEQALHLSEAGYTVGEAMRYSTLGGGKRIRGVLTLAFCRAFGGEVKKAVCIAAAIEMIHAFSLIHDDLPCMDDDDFRRGKPSCHKEFGESAALLAGDALLANAFNTISAAAFLPKPEGLKPQNVVSIISTLSNAATEMIKGQQQDMAYETSSSTVNEEELLAMYNRKTCALISGACVSGAMCADVSGSALHDARGYGFALGLAFQITDDLLDLKTEKAGKKTLPLLIGEKKSRELARSYTDTAVKIAEKFPKGDFLKELATSLNNRRM